MRKNSPIRCPCCGCRDRAYEGFYHVKDPVAHWWSWLDAPVLDSSGRLGWRCGRCSAIWDKGFRVDSWGVAWQLGMFPRGFLQVDLGEVL